MQEYPYLEDDEYSVTIPCTVDPDAMAAVRKVLFEAMLKIGAIVDASKEEHLAFITLDLMRIRGKVPKS